MRYPPVYFLKQMNTFIIKGFMILFVSCVTIKLNLCSPNTLSLNTLPLDGHFNFREVHHAARDFGNRYHFLPMAVLHPKTVSDIANTIKHIWDMGPRSELTVAARGHGHSLQGQAQTHRGVVINMESLEGPEIQVYTGSSPYVDVSGGELWINILHESLKYGLAPKSWTDYLHLTIGGTLSNAGISGQAFRHGPQISNVHRLEVVTGKGEVINCSEEQNEDLFHSVLGGLGQFGIITRARISLEAAPFFLPSSKPSPHSDFGPGLIRPRAPSKNLSSASSFFSKYGNHDGASSLRRLDPMCFGAYKAKEADDSTCFSAGDADSCNTDGIDSELELLSDFGDGSDPFRDCFRDDLLRGMGLSWILKTLTRRNKTQVRVWIFHFAKMGCLRSFLVISLWLPKWGSITIIWGRGS